MVSSSLQFNSVPPSQSPSSSRRPRLAIATGDPAGIGPEVVLKALADSELQSIAEITVVGSQAALTDLYTQLAPRLDDGAIADPRHLTLLDLPLSTQLQEALQPGQGNAASGEISFRYLDEAIARTLAGEFDGIVTAPIAKSAWSAAGHVYPGQTELLAERAGVDRFGMLFVARSPHTGWTLRTLLATTHIPLQQVPVALTPELMTRKLDLLIESLRQDFGLTQPRIAIAGLNPHSGEQGQLGREEQDWLIDWIGAIAQHHPSATIDGPVPPDTLWVRPGQAWFGIREVQAHDAYLALYHDQGLIPVKLMGFDRAVNTTIGLPFVRTSPDHGTAFDIANQGIADATSMNAAIQLAAELVHQRLNQSQKHA